MPDIGMVDLITPIQAGANIVAQANNIRRQREQMVLQRIQAQQRGEELKQLGIVRQNEAQKAQYELQTEKEKKAARIVFGESYNKAYSEFVKTKPDSTESERSAFALRTALPQAHPDDIPEIVKSVSASAMGQDKNAIAMQNAIARMEYNARLADFKIENLTARIEHYQKQAELAQRTIDERASFHDVVASLQAQKQQAEAERDKSKEGAQFVIEQTKAGDKAYTSVARLAGTKVNGVPVTLDDANTAKYKAMREFGERWSKEHGYRTSTPTTQTTNAAPKPKTVSPDPDNADAETSVSDQPTVAPEAANKKFNFDPEKGLIPAE